MKARLALVARDVIIAADTGVPSAINIMEGILTEGFPTFLHGIAFLTVWRREEGDPNEFSGEMTVLIDDREVIKHAATIAFMGDSDIARQVAQLQGLVLEKPSTLLFRLKFGEAVAECTVFTRSRVQVAGPQEEPS